MAKRQGFFTRMYHEVIKNDIETVHTRVMEDVVIPTVQNLVIDGVTTALASLFGKSGYRVSSGYRTSYSSHYSGSTVHTNLDEKRDSREAYRKLIGDARSFNPAEYILNDRADAEMILIDLYDDIQRYGKARLSDFYTNRAISITPEPVAFEYGWTDLDGVRPISVVGGWILNLPQPKPINR